MRTLMAFSLLPVSACGHDTVPAPVADAGWVGDPAPSAKYTTPAVFKELCEDGSDRSYLHDLTFIMQAGPDAMPDDLFTLDVRVNLMDGSILDDAAWAQVTIASDGTFDTGDLGRAVRMHGRFERNGPDVRTAGQLAVIIVEDDFVQCNRTYDFASE